MQRKIPLTIPNLPFRHALKHLSSEPSLSEMVDTHRMPLDYAKVNQAPAHNVIIVTDWMLVIPRFCARQGVVSANAAAMVGVVWVTKEEVLQEWLERGPMKLPCGFGIVEK